MKYLALILLVSTCNRNVDIIIDNVACNDNNGCTEAIATYVNDSLTNCFYQDTCVNSDPCEGVSCDDSNACTSDFCNEGHCEHSPITIVCNDNNPCTADFPLWQCPDSVTCVYSPIGCNPCDTLNCDDGNACTVDTCNNGICERTYSHALCNDNESCTIDVCYKNGNSFRCEYLIQCDDNNVCTVDHCDSTGHFVPCWYTPIDNCNDNDECTRDICIPSISWQIGYVCNYIQLPECLCDTVYDICEFRIYCPGEPPVKVLTCPDDALFCTYDWCDPITAECLKIPTVCDTDGDPCTDYCDDEQGGCVFYLPNPACFGKKFPFILDLSGREMTENFEDLPQGMYVKHYIENGAMKIQKIVRQ